MLSACRGSRAGLLFSRRARADVCRDVDILCFVDKDHAYNEADCGDGHRVDQASDDVGAGTGQRDQELSDGRQELSNGLQPDHRRRQV